MSGFDYDALPAWPEDDDQAHDVSAAPECDANVKATLCGMDERGDVAYLEDIPLVVRKAVPVRFGEFSFYALMAEPRDKARSAFLHGKDLVMATFPVARGWYDHGNFQFGTKHKARNPGKEIEQAFASQPRLRRDLLQKLGRNPFDTRHDVATAVLCDPYALDPLKKFILGRQSYYGARGGRSSPQSLMAICDDLSTLRQHLLGDTLLCEMVNATFESRDLFLRFHRSLLALLPSQSRAGLDSDKDAAKYMIFPEIADSRLAGEMMRASIDLALAGPENFEEFRENLDDDRKPDGRKLAKHRARDIYLQLCFNLWKRTARVRRTADRTRFLTKDPAQNNVSSLENEFWAEVERLSGEIDLSPSGIQATAETMIAEYEDGAANHGLLHGPRHQDSRGRSLGESEHWTVVISFLLHAAAILGAGHRPAGLSVLLGELENDEVEHIRMITRWVRGKHSI